MGLMDKVTQIVSKDKHGNTTTASHGTDSSVRHPVSSEHNQYAAPGAFPGENTSGQGSHLAGASASHNTYDPSRQDGSSGFGPNSGSTGLGSHSNTSGLGSHSNTTGLGPNAGSTSLGSHSNNTSLGSHSNTTGLGSNTGSNGIGSQSNTTGLGSNTNTGYGSSHGIGAQDHVNRDGYGSSNTTGQQSTAGPHNSDTLNKIDPRIDSDASKTHQGQSGLTGTGHSSNQHSHNSGVQGLVPGSHAENPSAIPTAGGERVGSTDDTYGSNTGYPSSHQQSTTAGPHNSNLLNKADPRVDSDQSRVHDNNQHYGRDAGIAGASVGAGAYGPERNHNQDPSYGRTEPHTATHKDHGLGSHNTTTTHSSQPQNSSSQYGSATTDSEHKSSLLNKLDPRVKDEAKLQKEREQDHHYGRDAAVGGAGVGAGVHGAERHHDKHSTTHSTDSNFSRNEPYGTSSTTGTRGTSNTPYTTTGPHNTFAANQLDPHVSGSDRSHGTTGLGSSTTHHGLHSTTADNTTAGPHKNDMLNKLDPRVDSDQSKLRDQQYSNTGHHNTGRSGVDDISHGTSGLSLGSGSSHNKHDYGYSAAHQSAYDQGYKDALAHFESRRRN